MLYAWKIAVSYMRIHTFRYELQRYSTYVLSWVIAVPLWFIIFSFCLSHILLLYVIGFAIFSEFFAYGLQIGIKAEWRAQHGRLVLFLGNKNTSPLDFVQALILPPAHLKMELSLVPETIPPRAQVKWLALLLLVVGMGFLSSICSFHDFLCLFRYNVHLKSWIFVQVEMLLFLISPTSLGPTW